MSASKVVIIVLVLFAILFAAGVGVGMRDDNSNTGSLGWVEGLSDAFSPKVDFSSLTGECIQKAEKAFVLQPGRACVVSIPAGEDETRNLKMVLSAGTQVTGRYKAPTSKERLAEQEVKLQKGKRENMTVAVLAEGGALTLNCPPGPRIACKIEMK